MRAIDTIARGTAAGIALAYRSGETSPVALTEHLLERIAATKADNIFISVTADRARREAKEAEARYRRGRPLSPLDGVPLAWKDLFDVTGARTTAGSRLLGQGELKTSDVPVVAHAARAGMVSLGKVNMSELAFSGLGLNPHHGTPRNPHGGAILRAPGGSSSGSGAAVAAGLAPIAIGSDTGGSVRIPAAFNGVVGFKTSTGRIDATGIVPLARTFDTIGPLARSVEDCILTDMVLRGALTTSVKRADLNGLRIVVPENVVFDSAEPAVVANFERVLAELERNGVHVRRARLGSLDEVLATNARHGTLTAAEAYLEYRDIVDSDDVAAIDRRVVSRIVGGKKMSAHDVLSIQRGRILLKDAVARELDGALLAMPTAPITAPAVEPLEADDELFHATNLRALRNTMLGNFLDLCGVALPNGSDEEGMPISFLLSALHGEDERVLGAALEVERVIGTMLQKETP